jgi:hypothetical protein
MPREIAVDQAIYLANDETKTYRFLRRNPVWEKVDPEIREQNKQSLDGYTRIFPDGRKKVFRYQV